LLQVHAAGVRQIVGHAAGEKRVIEWPAPGKKTITQAACNSRQCAVALSGGEVVYFELDASYELVEKERRELGSEVRCMALGPVPTGSQRCDFLAVGDARSAHVWSTRPDKTLQSLSTQALREGDSCSSLVLMELPVKSMDHHGLYLNLGTDNGLLYRSEVDRGNGQLTETHTRFLGPRPVKLSCVKVAGKNALLALSDRTWLSHRHHNNFLTAPLAYDALDAAAPLVSQDFDCIVAIADGTLRVFTVEKLGQLFNQQHVPLRYTPRKSSVNPVTRRLVVIETDHNAFNSVEKAQLKLAAAGGEEEDTDTGRPATVSQAPKDGGYESDEMEVDEPAASSAPAPAPVAELPLVVEVDDVTPADEAEEGVETVPEYMRRVGPPIPGVAGKWASCIRVFDPMALATLQVVELPDNEAAFSVAHVQFFEKSHEMFLLVGTVRDMTLHPRKHSGGFIRTYRYNHDGSQIELVHKTEVEDVPYTITQFSAYGKALVGVGNVVRVYDLGKKKLLRKCETKALPTLVQSIHCNGDRVYAGDASDSFVFLKYRRSENVLVSFADDLCARYLTASCMVDYSTVAGADKFGNVFLLRLPKEVGEDVDNPTGDRILWDSGWLGGAPHKVRRLIVCLCCLRSLLACSPLSVGLACTLPCGGFGDVFEESELARRN
jgi:splicing factor 3B subunit 3